MKMFYRKPAENWKECIPIGNGRLGGMILGDPEKERIYLNEDSLWSGYWGKTQQENAGEGKTEYLEQVRRAVEKEEYKKAEELLEKHLLGEFTESYLPIGTLCIDIPALQEEQTHKRDGYERGLTLDDGIAWTRMRTKAWGEVRREYFCSCPDECMVIHIEAERPLPEVKLSLTSELRINRVIRMSSGVLEYEMQCPEHVDPNYVKNKNPIIWGWRGKKFQACIEVVETDGSVSVTENDRREMCVKDATYFTILFTAVKRGGVSDDYTRLRERHVKDYQTLYSRVSLDLGVQPEIPTDERLAALRKGKEDNPLFALYFQYGRYLLISSSRGKDNFPATLQGIWCWEMQPPWSSNWTTNINVQMNYWPVQKCNLPECLEPYLSWMKQLKISGAKTAQSYFGCRGYCVSHNVDGWYATSPVGIPYGGAFAHKGCSEYAWFPLGGVWLCQEVWRAYEYRSEPGFLKDTVLPLLGGAVEFCLDWLVPFGEYYVTNPSASPEHRFEDPKEPGGYRAVGMASTMDMSLIKELFLNYRSAVECARKESRRTEEAFVKYAWSEEWERVIKKGENLLSRIDEVEPKLFPFCLGEGGKLQEWYKDFREKEKGHRHLSHLYGLFPGELFCNDEKLTKAARNSLDYRMENGSGQTGWSCAWAAELYAVLGDEKKAFAYLRKLLTDSTYDNLWDAHPPFFFQIDGNMGGISAIADMLVQDRGGEVKLLPALPQQWSEGSVKGLRIKNNRVIDISWRQGKVSEYLIHENR